MGRRIPLLLLVAALLLPAPAVAQSKGRMRIVLQRSDVPSAFSHLQITDGPAWEWANANAADPAAVGRAHMIWADSLEYTRTTRSGLYAIWSFLLQFRGTRDVPAGYRFVISHERDVHSGFPQYRSVSRPRRRYYRSQFLCHCGGRTEYRLYLYSYRRQYVVGTELRYLAKPQRLKSAVRLLERYEDVVLKRIQ